MRVLTLREVGLLKKEATRLKKEKGILLSRALDEIARAQGWRNWPLLMRAARSPDRCSEPVATGPTERDRYFVHGDQNPDGAARFYCDFCARFEPAAHFAATHAEDAGRRVLASLEGWRKLPLELKFKFARANAAPNLFQHLYPLPAPPSQQTVPRRRNAPSGMFHGWLKEQSWRPDAVGDFARRVDADPTFPVATDSPEEIAAHLRHATVEEVQAFDEAWEDFLEAVR